MTRIVAFLASIALLLAGCGRDGGDQTRLERAMADIPGKDPLGSGYGWIDAERLDGADLEWASDALGPDARNLGKPRAELEALGLDALDASAIYSITSNYAFSMRFDGVDPSEIERSYRRAGAEEGEESGWTTFDLESESSIPLGTPAAPLGSLGARIATRGGQIALARRDLWRSNLIGGERDPALDTDLLAAGAECLGDVVAARFMLNNHTYLPGLGPDLMAFGVEAPADRPAHEVFCAIDEDQATVDDAAAALRKTFGPGGRDAILEEPTTRRFSEAAVEPFDSHGLRGVRVSLVDAPGTDPGEVFGAADRGSVVTWMGFQRPPKPDGLR